MKVLHKADTRGHANHGWFSTHHTFSFSSYYDPERMHFGMLRVLNDDYVEAGKGFGTHPHDNMEIISIVLAGKLQHKDSMGNSSVIPAGDVQVMSAGTGVYHSEHSSGQDTCNLLQIWVFPNKRDVAPRYGQTTLNPENKKNKLDQIVSPNPDDEGLWIYQDAWLYLGTFEQGKEATHQVKRNGNGVYVFVISGKAEVDGELVDIRDGLGVWDTNAIHIKSLSKDTEILLIDVPMR